MEGIVRFAATAAGTLFLSVLLTGADRQTVHRPVPEPCHLRGIGILPLTGELAPLGLAFRDGFLEGIRSSPDSLFEWKWEWKDGTGDPQKARALLQEIAVKRTDLVLAGLSTAAAGIGRCPIPCLVLDDGEGGRDDSLRWDLWTPASVMRDRWIRKLRATPVPRLVVVQASGAWTEPVFPILADSVPGISFFLHDPDNSRWDDAVQRILELRPATLVLWNAPSEASSLLSRKLAWPVYRSARMWVPEGAVVPPGMEAEILRPLWQAVPGAPEDGWKSWGVRCGRALAESSRRKILDSLPDWRGAFRRVHGDSLLETGSQGWYPPGP